MAKEKMQPGDYEFKIGHTEVSRTDKGDVRIEFHGKPVKFYEKGFAGPPTAIPDSAQVNRRASLQVRAGNQRDLEDLAALAKLAGAEFSHLQELDKNAPDTPGEPQYSNPFAGKTIRASCVHKGEYENWWPYTGRKRSQPVTAEQYSTFNALFGNAKALAGGTTKVAADSDFGYGANADSDV